MLNNFQIYDYNQAKYIVMKELDTRGPIGAVLISYIQNFDFIMSRIITSTDEMRLWKEGEPLLPPQIPLDFQEALYHIARNLPYMILKNSEYDWNTFISAYISVLYEYCELTLKMNHLGNINRNNENLNKNAAEIEKIKETLDPTLQLVTIGIGYSALIQASEQIMADMKAWRDTKPATLKLSDAYLAALGFKTN